MNHILKKIPEITYAECVSGAGKSSAMARIVIKDKIKEGEEILIKPKQNLTITTNNGTESQHAVVLSVDKEAKAVDIAYYHVDGQSFEKDTTLSVTIQDTLAESLAPVSEGCTVREYFQSQQVSLNEIHEKLSLENKYTTETEPHENCHNCNATENMYGLNSQKGTTVYACMSCDSLVVIFLLQFSQYRIHVYKQKKGPKKVSEK